MKTSYLISLILFLGGLAVTGFTLGYGFHMSTALQKFARETDRTSTDYDWSLVWITPPKADRAYPAVLAKPKAEAPSSRDGARRWRFWVENVREPCDPDDHRLVWRYEADRWELVDDLKKDRSVDPFPPEAEGAKRRY